MGEIAPKHCLPLQVSVPHWLLCPLPLLLCVGIPGEHGFIPLTAESQGSAPATQRLPWPCPLNKQNRCLGNLASNHASQL